jgi:hypothetical protein
MELSLATDEILEEIILNSDIETINNLLKSNTKFNFLLKDNKYILDKLKEKFNIYPVDSFDQLYHAYNNPEELIKFAAIKGDIEAAKQSFNKGLEPEYIGLIIGINTNKLYNLNTMTTVLKLAVKHNNISFIEYLILHQIAKESDIFMLHPAIYSGAIIYNCVLFAVELNKLDIVKYFYEKYQKSLCEVMMMEGFINNLILSAFLSDNIEALNYAIKIGAKDYQIYSHGEKWNKFELAELVCKNKKVKNDIKHRERLTFNLDLNNN